MLLKACINLLQGGYWCGGGVTSVDILVIFSVASFSLLWCCVSSGTCICCAIGSTLRVGEVLFSNLRTCVVYPTTLGTFGVNCSTLINLFPCCGRWVSGGFTAHLKNSDSFLMTDSSGSSTLNFDVSVGFPMAWINCDAEIYAAYGEDVLGMSKLWGKKSNISDFLSPLVLGV